MVYIPGMCATDEAWRASAERCCEELIPHLAKFIADRFSLKSTFVHRNLWRTYATVSARTTKYDIYLCMFKKPYVFWSRECLVLARIGFKEQRVGHGRALVELLVSLAPDLGYRFLVVEFANAYSAAFAEKLGFVPYENGLHWVGSVDAIRGTLSHRPTVPR